MSQQDIERLITLSMIAQILNNEQKLVLDVPNHDVCPESDKNKWKSPDGAVLMFPEKNEKTYMENVIYWYDTGHQEYRQEVVFGLKLEKDSPGMIFEHPLFSTTIPCSWINKNLLFYPNQYGSPNRAEVTVKDTYPSDSEGGWEYCEMNAQMEYLGEREEPPEIMDSKVTLGLQEEFRKRWKNKFQKLRHRITETFGIDASELSLRQIQLLHPKSLKSQMTTLLMCLLRNPHHIPDTIYPYLSVFRPKTLPFNTVMSFMQWI